MIKFYLPNIIEFQGVNLTLWDLLREHPEWFEDGVEIGAVYGTFNNAIWNGGRVLNNDFSDEDILNSLREYEMRQIPVRFTWTNTLLKPLHLQDKYCNWIMESANNGLNEVIINSDLLEEYIREKYPKYKIVSSTTKCLLNKDTIKEEINKYPLMVLDYRKNRDFKFLEELNKNKIEILINPVCPIGCRRRKQHYDSLSLSQLGMEEDEFECKYAYYNFYDNMKNNSAFISKEELYDKFVKSGFKHFKIEGRTNHIIDVVEIYIYYMVKDEYKDIVRNNILKAIW